MKYYKFIGDKEEALFYKDLAGNEPKKRKIYSGDSHNFTRSRTTVESWANYFPEDWKKVKKKKSTVLEILKNYLKYLKKY